MGVNAARYEVPEVRALIDDMAQSVCGSQRRLGIRSIRPDVLVKKIRAGESPLTQHAGSMRRTSRRPRDELGNDADTSSGKRRAGRAGAGHRDVYRMAKGVEYAAKAKRIGRRYDDAPRRSGDEHRPAVRADQSHAAAGVNSAGVFHGRF